jgi:hypothetical protein
MRNIECVLGSHRAIAGLLLAASVAVAVGSQVPEAAAADHNDPVRVQATGADLGDPAADIADIFAFYKGPQGRPTSVVLALTWRTDPAYERTFDPTVRYGIHVDNDDDRVAWIADRARADYDIWAWFAKNASGQWGVKVENVPGTNGPITGLVGKTIARDGVRIMAGLFDDPFFFDLDGFFNGLSVALGNAGGNPSQPSLDGLPYTVRPSDPNRAPRPFGFVASNDGFGKTNVHAIVIEVAADKIVLGPPGQHKELHVWATTSRRKGGPR